MFTFSILILLLILKNLVNNFSRSTKKFELNQKTLLIMIPEVCCTPEYRHHMEFDRALDEVKKN